MITKKVSYLNLIQRKKKSRDKAMATFVEELEDRTPEMRCGACVALSILEATESIDQLVYLWQSDSSNAVQKRAKDALLTLVSYLNLIQRKKESRDKAMVTFVEELEDRTPEMRCGACVALSILEATESIDQLVYLWQSDSSNAVQKRAKDALLTLGDEGRKAFEEAQLSKHGFQGIQVHK